MASRMPQELDSIPDYEEYAYSFGQVKSVESKLITKKRMLEFSALENLGELLKGLEDTDYGPYLINAKTEEEMGSAVEKAFGDELDRIAKTLTEPKRWVVGIFRVKYDFNNFKLLYKAKFAGEKSAPAFSPLGSIKPETLASAWQFPPEDIASRLEPYSKQLKKAHEVYLREKSAKMFDFALEKEMFAYILGMIPRGAEGNFFRSYFKMEIDLYNMLSCLRVKREKNIEKLGQCYVQGGTLGKEKLISMEIESSPYHEIWEPSRAEYEERGSLTGMERRIRAFMIQYAHDQSLLKSMDPETVASYILKKEHEAQNIGLLLALKGKEVPEKLAERLISDSYA